MSGSRIAGDLSRLRRRNTIVGIVRLAELWGPALLLLAAVIVAIDSFNLWAVDLPDGSIVATLAVGSGMLLGVLTGLLKRKSLAGIASDIDRMYRLEERASAAWQFAQACGTDAYAAATMKDYENHRHIISAKEMYPHRHHRAVVLTPFLVALLIALPALSLGFRVTQTTERDIGEQLESYGRRMAVRAKEIESYGSVALAEEIERLGSRLRDESLDAETGQRALADMAQRIDGNMQGLGRRSFPSGEGPVLSEELRDSLNRMLDYQIDSGEVSELKRKVRNSGAFSPDELAALEQAFRPFENPESAPTQADTDYLRRLAKRTGNADEARELLKNAAGEVAQAREQLQGDAAGQASGTQQDERQPADTGESQGMASGGRNDASISEGEETGTPRNAEEGGSSGRKLVAGRPGEAEEEDEPGEPSQLSKPETPVLEHVQGTISSRDAVKAIIRNLPESDFRDIDEEQLVRAYQRQTEEILRGDSVPPSMRVYIRDYFIAIGVAGTKEEDGDE